MKILGVVGFVLALAFGTGAASAVPTTDYFTGSNPDSTLYSLGCSVGGFLNTGCSPTIGAAGAGVDGYGFGSIPDTQPGSIDSFPLSTETLVVTFLKPFTLFGFKLGQFGRADDFEYSIDGGNFFDIGLTNPTLFAGGINVAALYIRASTNNLVDIFLPDAFTLESITGEVNVAAVPVPAGIALLGSALGALGLVSWRKRKTLAA